MISKYTVNRILAGLARFVSSVLSPLLMPTYGSILVLWTSILCALPSGTRVTAVIVIMGITCIIPMTGIGLLHHFGFISDKRLNKPRERTIPYIIAVACYTAAVFYLDHIHAPSWFTMFAVGGLVTLVITATINVWWKISAHMGGTGGVVALIYQMHKMNVEAFDLFWVLAAAVFLAGVVGTSRLILKSHNVAQVLAGFANGFLCVYLAMLLFS